MTQGTARGRTRWWIVAAILLLPGLALAGFVAMIAIWVLSDDDLFESGPKPVPCVDVLHFGGAELPDGAEMVGECEEQGFQDLYYSARFRMPRADVEEWLALTYPFAPLPETDGCGVHDADLCLTAEDPAGHPDAGAQVVRVSVEYEDAATALVRFSAHTL